MFIIGVQQNFLLPKCIQIAVELELELTDQLLKFEFGYFHIAFGHLNLGFSFPAQTDQLVELKSFFT